MRAETVRTKLYIMKQNFYARASCRNTTAVWGVGMETYTMYVKAYSSPDYILRFRAVAQGTWDLTMPFWEREAQTTELSHRPAGTGSAVFRDWF